MKFDYEDDELDPMLTLAMRLRLLADYMEEEYEKQQQDKKVLAMRIAMMQEAIERAEKGNSE
jgi:hypothetical protein